METETVRNGLLLALGIASLNGLLGFFALRWAFVQSDKIFYGTLFGSMIWKLMVLAVTAGFIFGNPNFNFVVTLVSQVLLTFVFTLAGIWTLKKF